MGILTSVLSAYLQSDVWLFKTFGPMPSLERGRSVRYLFCGAPLGRGDDNVDTESPVILVVSYMNLTLMYSFKKTTPLSERLSQFIVHVL